MNRILLALLLASAVPANLGAYSVLSHEAIIDSAWPEHILPMLRARFPNAAPDDLRKAHAFAYGGAIVQDMGYYPHGSHFFSDLTHYVRSGDFIEALLHDAEADHDLNEYAFALGALAHYASDLNGHRIAVNRAVPLLYPHVEKKVGFVATYEDNPGDHLKTEFGFDVLEVAKQRYAPDAYRDLIGFEVAGPLLERAFQETYGIELRSMFQDYDRALNSYRYDVSSLIPKATKIAWVLKKDEIEHDVPSMTQQKFLFNISRASYEKRFGNNYTRPSAGERFLAFIIRILPKIGPLSALSFKTPTPQTEVLFMESFNAALAQYEHMLDQVKSHHFDFDNPNFDTGEPLKPGTYFMADDTYAQLVDQLAKNKFQKVSPELRVSIVNYYADANAPISTKQRPKDWSRLTAELASLKSAANPAPATQ